MPTIDQNIQAWEEQYRWLEQGDEWSRAWGGPSAQWYGILSSRRAPLLHESPYVPTQWAEGYSGVAQGDD